MKKRYVVEFSYLVKGTYITFNSDTEEEAIEETKNAICDPESFSCDFCETTNHKTKVIDTIEGEE